MVSAAMSLTPPRDSMARGLFYYYALQYMIMVAKIKKVERMEALEMTSTEGTPD